MSFKFSALISFVQDPNQFVWKGYLYAFLMFAAAMLYTFLQNHYFHFVMRVGMNLRTMLISAVFNKVCAKNVPKFEALMQIFCILVVETVHFC